jgi:hypothetical protein
MGLVKENDLSNGIDAAMKEESDLCIMIWKDIQAALLGVKSIGFSLQVFY